MSKKPEPEMVEVEIWASQRVEYQQVVRMPKSVFEKIDKMFNKDEEQAAAEVEDWIHKDDILDAEELEVSEFRIYKPVTP